MSANRIFLVCTEHPRIEEALLIADRAGNDVQYIAAAQRRADDWYAKHMSCGRGCDHFQIAYHRPPNWDSPKPAEDTPAGAVRLALVGGTA